MADQTKIDQFINLTGVDADRARFYIESAGGNVEVFSYPLILNMNVLYVCFDFTPLSCHTIFKPINSS